MSAAAERTKTGEGRTPAGKGARALAELEAGESVLVLVPSFDDVACLAGIAATVSDILPEARILVIDDGSKQSIDPAQFAGSVLFVKLPDNCGLGVCLQIAFDHALAHGYRAVVRVDSDGQHPLHRIPDLLAPLTAGDADLVVGTRENRAEGGGLDGLLRRCARAYYSAGARLITRGTAPRDVNSGFFAANRRAAERLRESQFGRFPEPELFIAACRADLGVAEISVEQSQRRHGVTRLNLFHALRMFLRFNVFVLNELIRGRP